MEKRRKITEEDLLVTEALIAESYGQLKKSVIQIPSRALGSVRETITRHPFAAAGTAVGAGLAAYWLFKMITPRAVSEEPDRETNQRSGSGSRHPDYLMKVISLIIPLVIPFVTGYLKKYIEGILQGAGD
jgi:hypothetical protein